MQLDLVRPKYLGDLIDLADGNLDVVCLAEDELVEAHVAELLVELLDELDRLLGDLIS